LDLERDFIYEAHGGCPTGTAGDVQVERPPKFRTVYNRKP
jgi:hypothetical protein